MTQFPSVFQNVLNEANQSNAQQPQMSQTNYPQPMQTKPIGSFNQQMVDHGRNDFLADYGFQAAGGFQQPLHNAPMTAPQSAINPQMHPYGNWYSAGMGQQSQHQNPQQAVVPGYGPLPQNLLDQIRYCTATAASPIFILPSGTVGGNQPASNCPSPIYSPSCIPYPVPMPILQSSESDCKCSSKKSKSCINEAYEQWTKDACRNGTSSNSGLCNRSKVDSSCESWLEHRCEESNEGAVCTKKNCPASIQLQAMVSQLLGIQGIISSAITRMLLKRIPGSNISESIEDMMDKSKRCIRQFSKEQLLKESKSSQQVNKLLSLYLTSASTLPRLIPILTTAQLKSNILRSFVESFVNARLMEDQGCISSEAPDPLDELILQMKSDDELRQLMSNLREKECEERVNLNFSAYGSQRQVTEARLVNVQKKIDQVEREMERRHRQTGVREMWRKWPESNCDDDSRARRTRIAESELDTDTPVSPRRLMLRPHVGSPETTYRKPSDMGSSLCEEVGRNRTVKAVSGVYTLDVGETEVCDKDNVEKGRKTKCFHIKLEDADC
ncbi:uncharacterized protein LOC100678110 isoform X1 [Nasonia vitripennis]|uniref:Uncharacterized protein n=2 Tax=Nasonia vitripennis TaxID=7425 RepID=A0A7M7HB95_NASVI|nr:uncharacterized protein LOC100678110 isoform X1 [Nasonia vitripennis]